MGNLYSRKKKKAHNVTDQDRAVLDLKNSRDRLTRYQTKLDRECSKLQTQALAMVKDGRKDRALLLLKVKKLKQNQADKASSHLLGVHQLMDTIDWESQQLKVFNALKEGNAALNKLHEEMPLEKVEELMADTAESIAMEEEISKAIGGSWTDANEEDLLAELAGLEKEEEQEQELGENQKKKAEAAAAAVAAAAAATAAATKVAEPPVPVPTVQTPASVANPSEVPVVVGGAPALPEEPGKDAAGPSLEELLPEAPTGEVVVETPVIDETEQEQEQERPTLVPA